MKIYIILVCTLQQWASQGRLLVFAHKMSCDILAGEQGPSCNTVKQIPDFRVIHVRFVEGPEGIKWDWDWP